MGTPPGHPEYVPPPVEPGRNALGLRLGLASLGFVLCVAIAIGVLIAGGPVFLAVLLGVIALTALVDMAVVVRRQRQLRRGPTASPPR